MKPSSDDQTTSSQPSQSLPIHVLEDIPMTAPTTVLTARHVHQAEFGPFRPHALFDYFPGHNEWEAVAYLLEMPLLYDKVANAWGRKLHDEMGDFDALIAQCHFQSEVMMAEAARDIWRCEGTVGAMRSILDADNFNAVVEALRVAGLDRQ